MIKGITYIFLINVTLTQAISSIN